MKMTHIKRRIEGKIEFFLMRIITFVSIMLLAGCGGDGDQGLTSKAPQSVDSTISIIVTPSTSSINMNQTQRFNATVSNSSNTDVFWKVGGITGGNITVGTISSSGLYSAPNNAATHTISATSVADSTKTASATLTVLATPINISVSILPVSVSMAASKTQQFTATVSPATNSSVIWKVDSIVGGNATVGLITTNGRYASPATPGTHVISATSVADSTKTASATLTVLATPINISVSILPVSVSMAASKTQQFTATVSPATNSSVIWKVDSIVGGNATVGAITTTGIYTSPATAGTHVISATSVADPTKSSSANIAIIVSAGVFTYHNDNMRSGQNLDEVILNSTNVQFASFGKLFSLAVDGMVYAQPLYVSNLSVSGTVRNVLFIVTEHNSVYAYDADSPAGILLWKTSFNDSANGITPVPSIDTRCQDINPEIGITSTPVIDPVTGTLYVVAMTKENGSYAHRLHALDITTGAKKHDSGIQIKASVPGTAQPNDDKGKVVFTSLLENQRTALLLSNNVIYFSTGSFCDIGDHHGWMFAYDAKTLKFISAFNSTPDGEEGGIWQSGGGAAADASGNIYVISGDGTFDAATGGNNYGNTFLKFSGSTLAVADYFTPYNQATLKAVNGDLGSGGALLLPDQPSGLPHLLVSAGKQGTIYLLNRDNLGKYQVGSDSQIVQSIPGPYSLFGTPAYYNNTVYMAAAGDKLKAYYLNNGLLSFAGQSTMVYGWPGATAVISADENNQGIVWTVQSNGSGAAAILRAHLATDISIELYNSNQDFARDNPGSAVKFSVPTVVNGKVYVGTSSKVSVFGLLP